MQIALTLLISAMSLLTIVNSNPNLSPEFKLQAQTVAEQAISYANVVMKEQTPTFGSTATTTCKMTTYNARVYLQSGWRVIPITENLCGLDLH